MTSFASRVNAFNRELEFDGPLPPSIGIMNPFKIPRVYEAASAFYNKYYNDNNKRKLIVGINPGRLGGGATGVPLTDPKRLTELCHIPYDGPMLHEPSSAYIYDMIAAFGGIELFYSKYYFNSVCPLGFVVKDDKGNEKNYNYFDSKALRESVAGFIAWNIEQQIAIGCDTEVCYCMGISKNYPYLLELNNRKGYFGKIVPLEHPRFIMQYKSKEKDQYISSYIRQLQ